MFWYVVHLLLHTIVIPHETANIRFYELHSYHYYGIVNHIFINWHRQTQTSIILWKFTLRLDKFSDYVLCTPLNWCCFCYLDDSIRQTWTFFYPKFSQFEFSFSFFFYKIFSFLLFPLVIRRKLLIIAKLDKRNVKKKTLSCKKRNTKFAVNKVKWEKNGERINLVWFPNKINGYAARFVCVNWSLCCPVYRLFI